MVHPVGPLDKSAIAGAADAAKPRGYTPIGQALRTAVDGLPREGPRSIVLVSDGIDTCAPPDPCEVAKELAGQGVQLRVHTVGYAVDGKARKQLMCIAQATGGTSTDVPDASGLGRALTRVTAAFADPGGAERPVVGGGAFGTAATLPGAGRYTEVMQFGEVLFYRVRLGWDQGLAYRVKYGGIDFNEFESAGVVSTLYSPARMIAGTETTGYHGKPMTVPADGDEAIGTLPIQYRNREIFRPLYHWTHSVAGWYYIMVKLGRVRSDNPHTPITVTLEVSLTGTPGQGPRYADTAAGQAAFGAPTPSPSVEAPTARRASSDDPTPLWWVGARLGGVALLALAVAGLVVARARRRSAAG